MRESKTQSGRSYVSGVVLMKTGSAGASDGVREVGSFEAIPSQTKWI